MLVLLLFLSLLLNAPAPGCLPVELRDAAGLPVTAVVEARAEHGQSLGVAATDVGGRVRLCGLPLGAPVLLSVVGRLPDGTLLVQQGLDAAGLRVFVDGSPEALLLRVEPTGAVVTDPEGWAREPVPVEGTPGPLGAVPVVAVSTSGPDDPTAVAAPTPGAVEPTAAPMRPTVPVPDVASVAAPAALSVGVIVGPPLCLIGLALVGGVGLVVFTRRRNMR
jgi:hypothetical protein